MIRDPRREALVQGEILVARHTDPGWIAVFSNASAIVVEREAHKGMIIGEQGERLKRIGSEARQELEQLWGIPVFLELWVKVRSGWADDEARVKSFGYE